MYLALLAGPIVVAAVIWLVLGESFRIPALAGPVGYGFYGLCAAGFAAGVVWRSKIPARGPESEVEFWRANLPRAFVLYALLEGVALLGSLVALLAGHPLTALAVVLVYLGLMIVFRPARLAEAGAG